MTAATWLRERAESYGTDARALRANGDTVDAVMYETIRNELRRVADQVDAAATQTPKCYDCGELHDGSHSEQFCSDQCRDAFMWGLQG